MSFHHRTTERLRQFLEEIAAHRGPLVRVADLGGTYLRAPFDTASMNRITARFAAYAGIVEALPSLSSLKIKALPYTNPLVLVTSPSLWSRRSTGSLRELELGGYPQPPIDGDAVALGVLDRFPLLTRLSLTLIGKNTSNAYTFNSFGPSLRRLQHLTHLTMRNVDCADSRLLEDGVWTAPIRELVLSDCTNLDIDMTFTLARQLSSTLEVLDVLAGELA